MWVVGSYKPSRRDDGVEGHRVEERRLESHLILPIFEFLRAFRGTSPIAVMIIGHGIRPCTKPMFDFMRTIPSASCHSRSAHLLLLWTVIAIPFL